MSFEVKILVTLKQTVNDLYSGQVLSPPPLMIADREEEYEVEEILNFDIQ